FLDPAIGKPIACVQRAPASTNPGGWSPRRYSTKVVVIVAAAVAVFLIGSDSKRRTNSERPQLSAAPGRLNTIVVHLAPQRVQPDAPLVAFTGWCAMGSTGLVPTALRAARCLRTSLRQRTSGEVPETLRERSVRLGAIIALCVRTGT